MCKKDIFTYVYPDNHRVEQVKHKLCEDSRHGQPCEYTKTFQHPPEFVRPGQLSPPAYAFGQFPPTPPLSSHSASASDSEHSSKERSGVYVNGAKVIDLNKRSSRRDKADRAVYGESPPLSRTPPRRYSVSRGSPSSSREETVRIHGSPRRRETSPEERERPSSSHFRPTIEVKVVNEQRHSNSHRRNGSSTKSSSQDGDEEDRRRRRRNSHVRFEDDEKKKKIQSEIERENEAIANRPPVPAASVQLSSRYRRGSVVVPPTETSLVAAFDTLSLDREQRRRERQAAKQREREEQRARDEEEAQKQRLKDRMAPRRQATVSHSNGRARQKVLYDDGMYYWE
ncbi:hypothetical protein F5Y05DRAFT_22472 [Hypoxylon sp. FL0543]|nr:hypothetical protein F5Y05DRAFT_22472 [Hypoxylon sp. FL0543]